MTRAKSTEVNIYDFEGPVTGRLIPDGPMPMLSCEGSAYECGVQLGGAWLEVLQFDASKMTSKKAWWKDRRYAKLISKFAPHLPDLYRGMAAGAGLDEDMVSDRASEDTGGCTSFAIAPEATLDGQPISGQSKDVSCKRGMQLLVLRLKVKDGPSSLTMTYPGWLFGHGFVTGGTSIFRNSLYVESPRSGMPYNIWGILALHCPTVEAVVKMTRDNPPATCSHTTIADENGGIAGIELGRDAMCVLKPQEGVYAHANCIMHDKKLMAQEKENKTFTRADSLHRTHRMYDQLLPESGRLTPQLAYRAMCDHDGFPVCIRRHEALRAITAAVVIAEPTRGLLHVTRTMPCQSWPRTYSL